MVRDFLGLHNQFKDVAAKFSTPKQSKSFLFGPDVKGFELSEPSNDALEKLNSDSQN